MLARPDERTQQALKRLSGDPDGQAIIAWLEHSLRELDRANRATMDSVVLRQTQGAAFLLAEIVDRASGSYQAGAVVRSLPAKAG